MAQSIQFKGIKALLDGYINTKAPTWSIWVTGERRSDKERMITKGAGADILEKFLDVFMEGSGNTIYVLRIYEEITDSIRIKENTPADGSFNFILCDDVAIEQISNPVYAATNQRNRLFERLGAIEQKLSLLEMPQGPEEKEETMEDILMDYLKNPHKIQGLINTGKSLLGIAISPQEAAIGSITDSTNNIHQPTQEEIQRLQTAINILEVDNPKLVEQLEKLAKIKQTDPDQWNFLKNMINKM
jgi:hypothetical protein